MPRHAAYPRKKRRPLAGPSGRSEDRRGSHQYNQSPSEYLPRSTMATVIAYIDGFNLYHGLHDRYQRRYLWPDLERLGPRIPPPDPVAAVPYFTPLGPGGPPPLPPPPPSPGALC